MNVKTLKRNWNIVYFYQLKLELYRRAINSSECEDTKVVDAAEGSKT